MARRLRPVGLDFAEVAPVRLAFTAGAAAAPEAVYRALAEEVEGWPRWFRAVTLARPTHGGAGREIRLVGGVRFQETIMAADPEQRYAYRVDETNAPGVQALLEEWRLTPSDTGTRVRWTFAADGPAPFRLALAAARPGLGHSFRTAVRTLDARLVAQRGAEQ
ncbi:MULTISPECIES: SRPBCC family protein [unclassified Streptomyces]|uniref:SRPBCC family protein n=1 Tax=unclassified Streptomyces TaxID=2593676 RepID=UPI001BEA3034|nr:MULTISPECIES: SRPBCC family protein [unclassified Streptomyces]MBT2405391.1 SRPBCC family protein [Streptomyces sp. ISL-21]MBT2454106.1 SRPBCC family protein [Streptomyces sp. ISL-86]MBT2612242.1 SRPBCC family protein [Streptomyces sp. ISL-87]